MFLKLLYAIKPVETNEGVNLNSSKMSFNVLLKKAAEHLNVRTGGYDCTMYGGMCGAGMNNFFYANGNVYICGNCIDMAPLGKSDMPFSQLETLNFDFDRNHCYKESLCE